MFDYFCNFVVKLFICFFKYEGKTARISYMPKNGKEIKSFQVSNAMNRAFKRCQETVECIVDESSLNLESWDDKNDKAYG